MNIKDLTRIALMTTMIAIGAFIRIPAPVVGSFTLQLTFVILAGILLGKKNGAISATVYAIGGLIGIPWFTMGGGFGYVLQPTFGFIVSFIIGAYIAGAFREYSERRLGHADVKWIMAGSIVATIVVWVMGMMYLSAIYQYVLGSDFGYAAALLSIFSVSLVADLLLAVLVSGVGVRVYNAIHYTLKGAR